MDCFRWCFYTAHAYPYPTFPFPDREGAYYNAAEGTAWRELFSTAELATMTAFRTHARRLYWLNEVATSFVALCPVCRQPPVPVVQCG